MQHRIPDDAVNFFHSPPSSATGGSIAVKNAFKSFLEERITSNVTADRYSRSIMRFANWCSANSLCVQNVEHVNMIRYRDFLDGVYSPAYANAQLSAVRTFFDWLTKKGCVSANPASSVRSAYLAPQTGSEALSAEQAAGLLASIDISTVIGLRNRAIVGAMMHGFIKTSDIIRLNQEDYFCRNNRWWFNLGQETSFRQIPSNTDLAEYMAEYLEALEGQDRNAPLFPVLSTKRSSLQGTRMSVRSVQRIVKRCAKEAALDLVTPRALRATGLKSFLQIGGRLEQAQRIAGHAHVSTTGHYMDKSSNQVVYEGDLDGLVHLLNDTASGPLEDFIRRSGIFRLSIHSQDEVK